MKIGILGCRGIPNQYGGFEQFAEYLSAGLADKGHVVFVYNSSLHSFKENKLGNVHIIHCNDPEDKWGTAGQFFYDRNCLDDSMKRGFDVLLHLGYTSDSIWHRRWLKKTVHIINMDGMEWKRSKYNFITRRFLRHAERLAANHADLLVADSIGIKKYLDEKYGMNAAYIPYGAIPFTSPDPAALKKFNLSANSYGLLIARMEPENNIGLIIKSWIVSEKTIPLIIISNAGNKYGASLQKKYKSDNIRFAGTVFDMELLNNLRYHSSYYLHGHSVGGTNPSLLEAMACRCNIIAHNNIFNRDVLGNDAGYFSSIDELNELLKQDSAEDIIEKRKTFNLEKIRKDHNWPAIVDVYEKLMLESLHQTA